MTKCRRLRGIARASKGAVKPPVSLDAVMREWAQESPNDLVVRQQAFHEATDAIRLYRLEHHGQLIWRAYLALRRDGFPVWEGILAKLDEWALALEGAHSAEEVARAIEQLGSEKSPKGLSRLASRERAWRIASAVKHAQAEMNLGPTAAIEWVAKRGGWQVEEGLGVRAVKGAYYATFPARQRKPKKSE